MIGGEKINKFFLENVLMLYKLQSERNLPPWYLEAEEIEAEDSEDAVRKFYEHHDKDEVRAISCSEKIPDWSKSSS